MYTNEGRAPGHWKWVLMWFTAWSLLSGVWNCANSSRGETEQVRLLLDSDSGRATIETPGTSGMRPLHMAARAGSVAVCQLLIDAGARRTACDGAGRTPLDLAMVRANSRGGRRWAAIADLMRGGAPEAE